MFSLKIIDTDAFLDMPITSRLLYYDLSMRADDDGFVASPRKIQRMIGCSNDDLKLLMAKQFVIEFESGVCVIKHWKIHNYIAKDRYTPTFYKSEMAQLEESDGSYELVNTKCIQNDNKMLPQVRLGLDLDLDLDLGKKKGAKKSKTFLSDSDEYRLSTYLFNFIKKNNVQAKEPNMQKWSKGFDSILRLDNRNIEDIKKIIVFSQKNEFWYKNILSPEKLRIHFEKLLLEMAEPKYAKKNKNTWADNCEQRAGSNIDDLEKKLLGWDK
ncbi:phage replication initiation protein [Clostridium estertheticum]|uniref:phage replication initiation protein n=1 Tax=Clostridium estertheticum TaxID=238834 RepID=UPI001C7D1D26|nr:phage replication initiation protein [Clostridium estertheticum]MBX4266583.1 phage replication initiation protein [Clostridium estertheticum]WLC88079.1 phage replication initiation protein [Clostridium estertheticum]